MWDAWSLTHSHFYVAGFVDPLMPGIGPVSPSGMVAEVDLHDPESLFHIVNSRIRNFQIRYLMA